MKEKGFIYIIKNFINNKVYIGQTCQPAKTRFKQHLKCLKSSRKQLICRAILKYGKENFFYEILEECDKQILNQREEYYIDFYNSYINGYNLTKGGSQSRKAPLVLDDINIVKLYKGGKSLRAIGALHNVSTGPIIRILKENNIKIRKSYNKILHSFNIPEQQLKEFLYLGWSNRKIAKFFSTDHHTIKRAIEKYSHQNIIMEN